jgi:hypothetical protein
MSRLYWTKEKLLDAKQSRERAKEKQELKGCTFIPKVRGCY